MYTFDKHIKVRTDTHHALTIYASLCGNPIQEVADELLRRGLAATTQGLSALALADSLPEPQADLGLIPRK